MKRLVKLTAMFLMLALACNMSLNAQRGMRGTMDSTRMNRMRMSSDTFHHHGMGGKMDPQWMRGMGPEMRGFDRGDRGPGELMLGSIPNVTEKQKKDIADLQLKQRDEMKKFRDEMSSKMKVMREAHKKNMMSILTDEQKKFIESKQLKTSTPEQKTK